MKLSQSDNSDSNSSRARIDREEDIECDYYTKKDDADDMVKRFASSYNNGKDLPDSFWIEKCIIKALDDFLDKETSFDGVRIYMSGKEAVNIIIVPTVGVPKPSPTYKHTDRWDVPVTVKDCEQANSMINLKRDQANSLINDFGEKFRKETKRGERTSAGNDSLSIAIWLDRCVIDFFAYLLDHPTIKPNGIRVYSAAYINEPISERIKYPHQSTLIFVPVQNNNPRWDMIDPPKALAPPGAANHGQLCPQICD